LFTLLFPFIIVKPIIHFS